MHKNVLFYHIIKDSERVTYHIGNSVFTFRLANLKTQKLIMELYAIEGLIVSVLVSMTLIKNYNSTFHLIKQRDNDDSRAKQY